MVFPPAITRCNQAYTRAYKSAVERREPKYQAEREAELAYRKAMPPLLGKKSIREFIACLAHGLVLGTVSHTDATKLLYAAQVDSIATNQSKKSKKQPKNDPKSTCISALGQPQTEPSQQVTAS